MRKLKNQEGITLVALVITIIILIILAGITLSIVLGENGLIAKAQKGAGDYKAAAGEEEKLLGDINAFLNGEVDTISSGQGNGGTSINAREVSFTPTDSNWDVDNVASALDWLYNN
ncbi:MAG: hypothetical protein J6M60_00925 [Clostridia bacterium]|nr:hypothetical protein [Clostridia bacterium]